MLKVYKKLFDELNNSNVKYVIYKGLNHLDEDLEGERGDVDIIVDNIQTFDMILKKNRWVKILKNNYPRYYFKLYHDKNLMLDVEVKIRLGEKPFKPYYFYIDINKLKTTKFKHITILANEDYIPLMFIMRVTAASDKKENLEELRGLLKSTRVNGCIKKIAENLTKTTWNEIEKEILKANSWKELKDKYKKNILSNVKIDKKALLAQKFKWIIDKYMAINRKFFKAPSYRVRQKGYLVAFIGNDGAGKTSTIKALLSIDYFKFTGIKMIYFGNNHYMIPGLTKALIKFNDKNRLFSILLSMLSKIDRYYLRVLKAKYFINKGYIVLADRYVYDDLMGTFYDSSPTNFFKKIYKWILKPRMLLKPNITFFLDVDPEVAYKRKRDYEFELVKRNVKRYRKFLSKFDEVVRVDANQSHDKVIRVIIKRLYEKDIEINKKY